jgi:hypothetical protein
LPAAAVAGLLVSVLSESLASLTSKAHPQRTVPPEHDVWKSVGASFRSAEPEVSNQVRHHVSFDLLQQQCVKGDAEMARMLGVDRTRISQKVKDKSLYAFDGREGRCFPLWQLTNGKPLRELKALIAALDPNLHPLTVDHWISTQNTELEINGKAVSPILWLVTGGSIDLLADLAAQL